MKKILALILALVMVLCLSACSDGYSGNTTNNTNSGNSINGNQGNNQNSSQNNQNNQSSNQSNNQNSNHTHNYAKNVIAVATCTTNGVESFTCSCGDFYTETVNATGHTPVKVPAVSATCTTEGKTEGSHCGTCGAVIVAQEVAPMTGHNYVSGTCSVCSVTLTLQDASNTYLYLTNSIQFSQETVNGYLAFSCEEYHSEDYKPINQKLVGYDAKGNQTFSAVVPTYYINFIKGYIKYESVPSTTTSIMVSDFYG